MSLHPCLPPGGESAGPVPESSQSAVAKTRWNQVMMSAGLVRFTIFIGDRARHSPEYFHVCRNFTLRLLLEKLSYRFRAEISSIDVHELVLADVGSESFDRERIALRISTQEELESLFAVARCKDIIGTARAMTPAELAGGRVRG